MRIINVVTAEYEKGERNEMLGNLKSSVEVCKRIRPDVGFHVLFPWTGRLNRILYVEQFPSLADHESWLSSWANDEEGSKLVRKQIELATMESVETFVLTASTAD